MLKSVPVLKNCHLAKIQIFAVFVLVAAISGCAFVKEDSVYATQGADELLFVSHKTPSKAEKIQIRAYLARQFPDTIGGMYSRTYLAYENGQRDLELKYLKAMMDKYPNDPNALHYQAFEGGLDGKLSVLKHGLEVDPSFLDYNFVIKIADSYIKNGEESRLEEFYALIKDYEKKLGEDIYVFDYARGMIEESLTKDFDQALKYFDSALLKKGGVERWSLWESYFDVKFPKGIKDGGRYDNAYIEEVQMAVFKLNDSTASDIVKRSVSHKLVKNLLADKARDAGYRAYNLFYKEANLHYFTSEVMTQMRLYFIDKKEDDKLLAYFQKGVEKLPNDPDALALLAAEYAYLKEYEKADAYYKRALKSSYVYADRKAYVREYAKDVLYPTFRADEAVELLQAVVDAYPTKASSFYWDLAITNTYAGNHASAKKYFEQYKADWEGDADDFPEKQESIINGFAERELEISGEAVDVQDKASTVPNLVATTSVFPEWLTVTPDQRHFLGNNGADSVYTLWDAKELSVIDRFESAILSDYYAKYMTKPSFSPDGRYVAYSTEFKDNLGSVMLVYDLQEHRFSHQLPMIKKTSGLAWSPDGDEIAIWNYGRLIKYNLDDNKVVSQGAVKGQDGADIMVWTANGKYLALLERSSEGSIRVFDANTLEQLHRLDQVNWPHALGVSVDGRYLFSADNRSTLHRWDTEKQFAHTSIKIPVLGRIIVAHPTKPEIVINDWRGENHLTLIDYEKMEIRNTVETGKAELRISYMENGEKILAANLENDTYEIYDSTYLRLINAYSGESAVVTGGAYANVKDDQLVTWDQDGLHVWSVTSGEKLHTWEGDFQSVMSDPEAPYLLFGLERNAEAETTFIVMFDLSDFTDLLVSEVDFIVDKWTLDGDKLILSGKPYMPMDEGFVAGVVMICDLNKKTCNSTFIDMITEGLKYDHLGDTRFTHLAVSPDQKHIALSTAWIDGWKQPESLSKVTRIYNIETGDLVKTIKHVGELVFKDNKHLAISDDDGIDEKTSVYSIKTGKSTGQLGEGFAESSVSSHTGWPRSALFPDKNLTVMVSKDNRIEFYNANDQQLVLTVLAKRDNAWIAYLPTGEYSSSEKGANKVYWELDGKKLTVAEAEAKYKRENVIKSKLKNIAEQ